jgi:hypothetical protein
MDMNPMSLKPDDVKWVPDPITAASLVTALSPFEPPSTAPLGPWMSPHMRLVLLLMLYVIVRALYFAETGR